MNILPLCSFLPVYVDLYQLTKYVFPHSFLCVSNMGIVFPSCTCVLASTTKGFFEISKLISLIHLSGLFYNSKRIQYRKWQGNQLFSKYNGDNNGDATHTTNKNDTIAADDGAADGGGSTIADVGKRANDKFHCILI